MKLLIIDNYDSFTYNLVHFLGELGAEPVVFRNDKITLDEIERLAPEAIVLSPGPATPNEAGICLTLIDRFKDTTPILGVCLGHQAIGHVFGGRIVRAGRLMHGKACMVEHDGTGLYAGMPRPFEAGRYHSLTIEEASLPAVLRVTARSEHGEIMGVQHRELDVEGVQFHPESVLTPQGERLIANFLARSGGGRP